MDLPVAILLLMSPFIFVSLAYGGTSNFPRRLCCFPVRVVFVAVVVVVFCVLVV